jgi:hypothetical protein
MSKNHIVELTEMVATQIPNKNKTQKNSCQIKTSFLAKD